MQRENSFAASSSLRPIKLDLVQAYVTYADAKNLTAAADQLCLTPSAVCQKIRSFEAIFSEPLFEQKGRTKWLTAYGKAVYDQARRLLCESKSLLALRRRNSATIRISVDAYLISSRCPYWEWLNHDVSLEFACAPSKPHDDVLQIDRAGIILSCSTRVPDDAIAIGRLEYGWFGDPKLMRVTPVPLTRHVGVNALELEPERLLDSQLIKWKICCATSDYAHIRALVLGGHSIALLPIGEVSASLKPLSFPEPMPMLTQFIHARPMGLAQRILAREPVYTGALIEPAGRARATGA
jgi:DNA-binding transcriptional LysR family regulator